MLLGYTNPLRNPRYLLTDYPAGLTGFSAKGKVASCWLWDWDSALDVAGAGTEQTGVTVKVLPTPTDSNSANWMFPNLIQVDVVAANYDPTAGVPVLYQKIDESSQHGRTYLRFDIWARGPVGGSFLYGAGGTYQQALTDGSGKFKRYPFGQYFGDIGTFIKVDIFRRPADLNTSGVPYQLAPVMADYSSGLHKAPPDIELRPRPFERALCLPYVRPIRAGHQCKIISATEIEVASTGPVAMRNNPVGIQTVTAIGFKLHTGAAVAGDGNLFVAGASTATMGSLANGDRGTWGGVFKANGFSGMGALIDKTGYLTTDLGLVEADIA